MDLLRRVGLSIRQSRKRAGYTLDELADKAGLSSGKYLGKIERGEANATLKTLDHIAQTLGLEAEDFFSKGNDEVVLQIIDLVKNLDEDMKGRILEALRILVR